MAEKSIRPTKKQRELLTFIQAFIDEHGYSPSYREIMRGQNYTSVATVALHVNSLITRGHLRKRDRSARSLEVVSGSEAITHPGPVLSVQPHEEKWLVQKVEHFFSLVEQDLERTQHDIDELYVLIGSLKILGLDSAVRSFLPRLTELQHAGES